MNVVLKERLELGGGGGGERKLLAIILALREERTDDDRCLWRGWMTGGTEA